MNRAERLRAGTCGIDGCTRHLSSFNPPICAAHRRRIKEHGSPEETPWVRRNQALEEEWARLATPSAAEPGDCWLWSGSKNDQGYGQVQRNGETLTHRAAWVAVNGPIPDGLLVCHHCDTPACYRPSHLFLGSHADNQADKIRKGRYWGRDGRRDGRIRLTDEQVVEIRALLASGEQPAVIAARFGVSGQYVGDLGRGVNRRSPTGVVPARPVPENVRAAS